MIRTLRRRFVGISMALVVSLLLAIFAGIYVYMAQGAARQAYAMMGDLLRQEVLRAERGQGNSPPRRFDDFRNPMAQNCFIVRLDGQGGIDQLISSLQIEDAQDMVAAVAGREDDRGTAGVGDYRLRYLRQEMPQGTYLILMDRSFELATQRRLLLTFLLAGTGGVAVLLAICLFLARRAVRPVELAWEKQRRFVADASHELKTPLTVMLANTDVVLSNPEETVESQAKWLRYVKQEGQRMTALIQDLLFLAKADDGAAPHTVEPVDLSACVTGACLSFEPLFFEEGKHFTTAVAPHITVQGNQAMVRQLVMILLDNASKHSDEHGSVKVELSQDGGRPRLTVFNTGEPIPPDSLPLLFERFYRVDKSRSRENGGSGLGLSIARSICNQLGYHISASAPDAGGALFSVKF